MSTFLAMAADLGYAASRPEQYGYAQDENIQAAFCCWCILDVQLHG